MAKRYEIRNKIGQGGLGEVYVAYDTQLGREVALKRLRADVAEKTDKDEDLFKEAKVMSTLMHPNVVTIFDVGHDEQGPFAVMELLKGETFDTTVERGALTLEDFRRFVQQTLEGMIAAQAIGLMHRDIKPSNLMVIWLPSGKFQVKILDFGLAKFAQKPTEQTSDQGDGIMGSIFFMAPEQFERLPLGKPTDMYSLGCVYYYGLTQQHPYEGDNPAQVMASHLRHDVKELKELRPDLPEEVCTWVMWMINRKPEDRPADASEALEYFREGDSSHPAPAQAAPPTRPLLVTGAAAMAVPAQAPPGLAVGARTAQLLSAPGQPAPPTAALAGSASQPLGGAGAAYLAKQKGGKGKKTVPGGAQAKKGTFPMWALVTFPLLLVAAIGFGGYSMYQSGQKKKANERFEAMFNDPHPQGDVGTVREVMARLPQGGNVAVAAASILAKLEGPGVSQEIINQLGNLQGNAQINVIRAIAMREYDGASSALAEIADTTSDSNVRLEALGALAQVASEKDLGRLVNLLPELTDEREQGILQEAITRVLDQRKSEELRTKPLIDQLGTAGSPEMRAQVISMLGRIGGEAALEAITNELDATEDDVANAAMVAISQWPTAEPAPKLLEIASGETSDVRRIVALRSYIRLAGVASDIPASQRVSMLRQAFELAGEREIRLLDREIFNELSNIPDESALAFANELKDDPRGQANAAAVIDGIEKRLRRLVTLEPGGGTLPASKALIFGNRAEYQSRTDGAGVVTRWFEENTALFYTVGIQQPGTYSLKVVQAATPTYGGRYEVQVVGQRLSEDVKVTGSESEFTTAVLGEVVFGEPGNYQLVVQPLDVTGDDGLMLLRGIELEFLQ